MLHETIPITAMGHTALLTTYLPAGSPEIAPGRKRPLVIICPGGAYGFTSDREAEPVALRLNTLGFHACVLRYTVAPHARFPVALAQLAAAVALARQNAAGWQADEKRISVMGFSAGGHLAASLGVFWNSALLREALPDYAAEQVRPNRLALSYPVITSGEKRHHGSFQNLLGEQAASAESRRQVSLEHQVSRDTPPAFIWHTATDDAVPADNSLLFATALQAAGVLFELHIYPHGVHGLSLATAETDDGSGCHLQPECAGWVDMAARFLKDS